MSKRSVGITLLSIAFLLGLIGAVGQLATSVPAIRGHFSYEADNYWFHRLTASLILGSTGLFFGVLVMGLGFYFLQKKEFSLAGKIILLMSILPHIVSFITLPILTPSDWSHMITHGIIIIFLPLGVWLYSQKR